LTILLAFLAIAIFITKGLDPQVQHHDRHWIVSVVDRP